MTTEEMLVKLAETTATAIKNINKRIEMTQKSIGELFNLYKWLKEKTKDD